MNAKCFCMWNGNSTKMQDIGIKKRGSYIEETKGDE
jgi:hypothetical protein